MAEKFLEPQNPLKKIDETTGEIAYIYPLTTDKQVIMENGERLNTILNENILYLGDAEDSSAEVINADTFGGHTPTTFLSLVYPVGAIYMSANPTSPDVLFGFGTWERIKDTFLLSAGDTYSAGATGGEASHTLTINEMPSHNHAKTADNIINLNGKDGIISRQQVTSGTDKYAFVASTSDGLSYGGYTASNGGSKSHNNMPPYLAVYCWKRTA